MSRGIANRVKQCIFLICYNICIFFNISLGKHNLSEEERSLFLSAMRKIANASNEASYRRAVDELKDTSIYKEKNHLQLYVNNQWLNISQVNSLKTNRKSKNSFIRQICLLFPSEDLQVHIMFSGHKIWSRGLMLNTHL